MEWPTFGGAAWYPAIPKVVVRDPSYVQGRTMRILPPQMKLLMPSSSCSDFHLLQSQRCYFIQTLVPFFGFLIYHTRKEGNWQETRQAAAMEIAYFMALFASLQVQVQHNFSN